MDDYAQRALEHRLENWAFVVREGLLLQHCASFEHHYRPPRDTEERRDPKRLVDVSDGWLIEQAWRAIPSAPCRWLLKLHFVNRLERGSVIRWVLKRTGHAVKTWTYKGELAYALRQLHKSLDMHAASMKSSSPQFGTHLMSRCDWTLSGVQPRHKDQERQPAQV